MLIGYAQVSTGEQNLDLKVDALEQAGWERVDTDERSGLGAARPRLTKTRKIIPSGYMLDAQG